MAEMKNPYDNEEFAVSDVRISHRLCFLLSVVFVVLLAIPSVWQHWVEWRKPADEKWVPLVELFRPGGEAAANLLREKRSGNPAIVRTEPSLRDHLQAFEKRLKEADFRTNIRKADQARQLRWLGDGNAKVRVGEGGWLYYGPGLEALTGYGPLKPEPDSVAKDPDRSDWYSSVPTVLQFAEQLKERNIDLVLVPVPIKPMVHGEGLSDRVVDITFPIYAEMLERFEEANVTVVDLLPAFQEMRKKEAVFLKQDTHWTNLAMRLAARKVAEAVASEKGSETMLVKSEVRESLGDLAGMLGIPDVDTVFNPESQEIARVFSDDGNTPVKSDSNSDIVVLGDSFVNIYEDPSIGFQNSTDESLIGGGFASHLAEQLGKTIHVIASNGEGATGVRRTFAALPDNHVRKKKTVVWVLAVRDLLYSESAGRRAGVVWNDVVFNTAIEKEREVAGSGEIVVTGTLREKSAIRDPKTTPYEDALYSVVLDSLEVSEGEYEADEIFAYMWAFRGRVLQPTSKLKIGQRVELRLVPMANATDVSTKTKLDDLFRIDLKPQFVVEAREVKK